MTIPSLQRFIPALPHNRKPVYGAKKQNDVINSSTWTRLSSHYSRTTKTILSSTLVGMSHTHTDHVSQFPIKYTQAGMHAARVPATCSLKMEFQSQEKGSGENEMRDDGMETTAREWLHALSDQGSGKKEIIGAPTARGDSYRLQLLPSHPTCSS